MTRSQTETLRRLKAHLTRESRSMVRRGRSKRGCMFARWAVAISDAISMNKELIVLKNEKLVWK